MGSLIEELKRQEAAARAAIISNGDFEEHWRFHLEREHERLYPGIKRGQYTLSA